MSRRPIALALAAVGALGGLLAILLAAGAAFGNVAEWFQAVGTVAAFAVTLMLLMHEINVRRQDQLEREAEQARQITLLRGGSTSGTVLDPATGRLNRPFEVEITGTVINGSDALLSGVTILFYVGEEQVHHHDIGVVRADARQEATYRMMWDREEDPPPRTVACTFADRRKRAWRLSWNGDLERLPGFSP